MTTDRFPFISLRDETPMKKYLICPGVVRSISDNDMHYVSAPKLMRLYGVNREDCIIVDNPDTARGIEWSKYIVLRPNTAGDYSLPIK